MYGTKPLVEYVHPSIGSEGHWVVSVQAQASTGASGVKCKRQALHTFRILFQASIMPLKSL